MVFFDFMVFCGVLSPVGFSWLIWAKVFWSIAQNLVHLVLVKLFTSFVWFGINDFSVKTQSLSFVNRIFFNHFQTFEVPLSKESASKPSARSDISGFGKSNKENEANLHSTVVTEPEKNKVRFLFFNWSDLKNFNQLECSKQSK